MLQDALHWLRGRRGEREREREEGRREGYVNSSITGWHRKSTFPGVRSARPIREMRSEGCTLS